MWRAISEYCSSLSTRRFSKPHRIISTLITSAQIWPQTRNRPIVFVGHSLGGLVIQQALVLADHNKVFTDIRTSTSGIIFLGVPMQGSGSANILAFITDTLGNEQPILRTLKADSPELNALSDDFWSGHGALPAIFFGETNESHYVPLLKTTVSIPNNT